MLNSNGSILYNTINRVSIILNFIIPGAGVAMKQAYFGRGSGPIWLDNVACGGSESNLINCTATNTYNENHDCDHQEDAGVRCLAGRSNRITLYYCSKIILNL